MQKAAALFSALLLAYPAAAVAEKVDIETKSYIGLVNLLDASQFDSGHTCGEAAMAVIVDCAMLLGENPKTGSASTSDFRLRSAVSVDAGCASGKVVRWRFSPVSIQAGKEFIWLPTTGELAGPLKVSPAAPGAAGVPSVSFSYRMRGQPNDLANTKMNAAKPRSCTYIWHQVDGKLSCQGDKLAVTYTVSASAFPSIRSWQNGVQTFERAQKEFKALWQCSVDDPAYVR